MGTTKTTLLGRLVDYSIIGGCLLMVASAVVGSICYGSRAVAEIKGDANRAKTVAEDHEARLRTVERDVGQIAADVSWIRKALETR
jgi:hypothetical protein